MAQWIPIAVHASLFDETVGDKDAEMGQAILAARRAHFRSEPLLQRSSLGLSAASSPTTQLSFGHVALDPHRGRLVAP